MVNPVGCLLIETRRLTRPGVYSGSLEGIFAVLVGQSLDNTLNRWYSSLLFSSSVVLNLTQ